jgi:hypothetical protein
MIQRGGVVRCHGAFSEPRRGFSTKGEIPRGFLNQREETMRKKVTAVLLAGAFALSALAPAAFANPSPPTNGGNGAGQSGQCTGKASERPASCQSPK